MPNGSYNSTVIWLELTPAVSVCADVVNSSVAAAAGSTVSVC